MDVEIVLTEKPRRPRNRRLIKLTLKMLRQSGIPEEAIHPPDESDEDDFLDYRCGPSLFDEFCIYDACSDATCRWALRDFVNERTRGVGWDTHLELTKLLSRRGRLVKDLVEPEVKLAVQDPPNAVCNRALLLAYLPLMRNGEKHALKLLDAINPYYGEGLLLACYHMNTPAIRKSLRRRFVDWAAEGRFDGGTPLEHYLGFFIKKWLEEESPAELDEVIRLYFNSSPHYRPFK